MTLSAQAVRAVVRDFMTPYNGISLLFMPSSILRMAYVIEFLLAMIAGFEVWSQVGGQSHLDLMPWYIKLGLTFSFALFLVLGTSAAVEHEKTWNAKTLTCAVILFMIAAGMGTASYYYHLHENDDQQGDEEDTITWLLDRPSLVEKV